MFNFSDELVGASIGFLGVIIGSFLAYILGKNVTKYNARISLTHEILKWYNSPEFLQALRYVQEIRLLWAEDENKLFVNFFIPSSTLERSIKGETILENGLSYHQNLTLYLRFLSQIHYYYKEHLVSRKTIDTLFVKTHYYWQSAFLNEFVQHIRLRYAQEKIKLPEPHWISSIEFFDHLLLKYSNKQ